MIQPTALSLRAEAACRLLNLTIGLHRTQVQVLGGRSFVSRLEAPDFDGLQVQRQGILLRMLSITESYCADHLLEVAEVAVEPAASEVRARIWDQSSIGAISTWSGIQDSYKRWFSIRPNWNDLNRLVEVRNSIAHGLGELTRMQRTKRVSTVDKIKAAGIRLDGNRIVLEESDLDQAKRHCVALITEIDMMTRKP
jgi:hypothetical protein